ncbi:MAG TPA: hypothetical protein VF326_14410 [Anaerolineaceae bacterium]
MDSAWVHKKPEARKMLENGDRETSYLSSACFGNLRPAIGLRPILDILEAVLEGQFGFDQFLAKISSVT